MKNVGDKLIGNKILNGVWKGNLRKPKENLIQV